MNRAYITILFASAILFSCEKNEVDKIEDGCFFKGKFEESEIYISYGNGVYFANGDTYVHHDNSFTYGAFAQLENFNGIFIPRLKVEFVNHVEIKGPYSEEKLFSIFPSLFGTGKYQYVTNYNELGEIDESGIRIEYLDMNGKNWHSVSNENFFSDFEIVSSEIDTEYYSYRYVKKVNGKFSCFLFDSNYTKRIYVEDIEFEYLYFYE
jgi:hypothetical protein